MFGAIESHRIAWHENCVADGRKTAQRLHSRERTYKLRNNRSPLEAQGLGYQSTGKTEFHVLVVDDDRDTAESLCALLRIWGYQSEASCDAMHALRLACEYNPDCLMVDVDMPGMVGHTLAEKLRMHPGFGRVKFVALSLHPDDVHVHYSRAAGFDFHFIKPMGKVQMKRLRMLIDVLSALG
jgi:CheY-like chemotaxis protein